MNPQFVARSFAAAVTLLFLAGASAVTVFDPALGSPSAQQWTTSGAGGYSSSLSGGRFVLSTGPVNASVAGSALLAPKLLDSSAGFSLDFDLRIAAESHADDNQRAGFSVIFTGTDPTQSLELGFWQDRIFAYDPAFVPGASAPFATTAFSHYSLLVSGDAYRLLGNGNLLLAGSLVDYTGRGIAPYTTGGVLFFGDDTSRAQSVSELGVVSLAAPVPEPATVALLAVGLAALAAFQRRRGRSARVTAPGHCGGIGRGLPSRSIAT